MQIRSCPKYIANTTPLPRIYGGLDPDPQLDHAPHKVILSRRTLKGGEVRFKLGTPSGRAIITDPRTYSVETILNHVSGRQLETFEHDQFRSEQRREKAKVKHDGVLFSVASHHRGRLHRSSEAVKSMVEVTTLPASKNPVAPPSRLTRSQQLSAVIARPFISLPYTKRRVAKPVKMNRIRLSSPETQLNQELGLTLPNPWSPTIMPPQILGPADGSSTTEIEEEACEESSEDISSSSDPPVGHEQIAQASPHQYSSSSTDTSSSSDQSGEVVAPIIIFSNSGTSSSDDFTSLSPAMRHTERSPSLQPYRPRSFSVVITLDNDSSNDSDIQPLKRRRKTSASATHNQLTDPITTVKLPPKHPSKSLKLPPHKTPIRKSLSITPFYPCRSPKSKTYPKSPPVTSNKALKRKWEHGKDELGLEFEF